MMSESKIPEHSEFSVSYKGVCVVGGWGGVSEWVSVCVRDTHPLKPTDA